MFQALFQAPGLFTKENKVAANIEKRKEQEKGLKGKMSLVGKNFLKAGMAETQLTTQEGKVSEAGEVVRASCQIFQGL